LYGDICLVGDPHLGRVKFRYGDDPEIITRYRLEAFRKSIQYCLDKKCKSMFVLGDLFDSKSLLVHPSIIHKLHQMLWYGIERGLSLNIIAGNHDLSSFGDSSLWYVNNPMVSSFFDAGVYPIFGVLGTIPNIVVVPYKYHVSAKDCLEKIKPDVMKSDAKLLLGHFNTCSQDALFYTKNDPWTVDLNYLVEYCKEVGLSQVVLGHQHKFFKYQRDGVSICCLGALSPTARDQQGYDYGNVAFYSLTKNKLHVKKNAIKGIRYVRSNEVTEDLEILHLLLDSDSSDKDGCIGIGLPESTNASLSTTDNFYNEMGVFNAVKNSVLETDGFVLSSEAFSFLEDFTTENYPSLSNPFSLF
jgi:DNA repair exonuclease SbcCD nuclease subunit